MRKCRYYIFKSGCAWMITCRQAGIDFRGQFNSWASAVNYLSAIKVW